MNLSGSSSSISRSISSFSDSARCVRTMRLDVGSVPNAWVFEPLRGREDESSCRPDFKTFRLECTGCDRLVTRSRVRGSGIRSPSFD